MISVVTGTLNRLELLKHVIDNTVRNSELIELVLVDGGSTDGTIEYVRSLNHPRIKLIEIGYRSPYPHYMNIGVKNATHELIAQWNDDVLLCNNWSDIIKEIDGSDYYMFPWTRGSLEVYLTNKSSLFKQPYIFFEGCMNFGIYQKKVFREIGLYDSQFHYYWCDSDMTARCTKFNLKRKECKEIRVMEINTVDGCTVEKKTMPDIDNYGFMVLGRNNNFYDIKKIPTTIEYL
jgi:glycosyltransferase involved in cell wall biosynthesis